MRQSVGVREDGIVRQAQRARRPAGWGSSERGHRDRSLAKKNFPIIPKRPKKQPPATKILNFGSAKSAAQDLDLSKVPPYGRS
jgi:hypothetical protein